MSLINRKDDGSTEGADPRTLSPRDLREAGHIGGPLLKTIRAKCLDCVCYQPIEIRRCTATACPLWPYRMATNPFAKPRGAGKRIGKSGQSGAENLPAEQSDTATPLKRAA